MDKPWMDASLGVDERVEKLLAMMTIEEKAGQLTKTGNMFVKDAEPIRSGGLSVIFFGSGALSGNVWSKGATAETTNATQRIAVEESRLGIPILFGRDVIHGHRTVFPIPLGQAAAWSAELVERAAAIAAREATADGLRWTFTPMLDLARDPRWGRIAEGFGEDPFLGATLAAAAVRGYQGDDLGSPGKLAACPKHYLAYGAAEGGRDYDTADIGERSLRDTYLPPFAAAVRAGAASIMSGFNEIDGVPVTANRHVLTEILRGELGFEGFVVTDYNAVAELICHGVAEDGADAVELALRAGVDMDNVAKLFVRHLPGMVRAGRIDEAAVNDAVRRVLKVKFRLGLFDRPYTDPAIAPKVMLCGEHRAAAREFARKSIVLLKNNGLLPLAKDIDHVLLCGPMARARAELFGTWTLDGRAEDVVPVEQAVRELVSPKTRLIAPDQADTIVQHAKRCSLAVVCVGEHPARSGEDNCVADLGLPPGQLELLQAIHAVGCPLVVVIFAGRPLAIPWVAEHADAILYAWHPGVEGGRAVADLLFGEAVPSGKTPVSFPRAVGQVPIYYNHKPTGRPLAENVRQQSRYLDCLSSPLYPFGFGLSYTTFEYVNLRLSADRMPADGVLSVSVDVTNTGSRAGEEVVQLYVRDVAASVSRPVKELKGFARVALQPGETRTVTLPLAAADLAFTDLELKKVVEPGAFRVWVGPSSAEGLEAGIRVV